MIVGRHVLDAAGGAQAHPTQRRAGEQAPGDRQAERRRHGAKREPAGDHRADRQPVNEQGTGVVEEALAFEDRHEPLRRLERAQHGGRRGRVRRRDDGAEGNGGGPLEPGNHRAGNTGDGERGQADADDDQPRDRPPVVSQIPQRRVVGGVQQHRRDEQRQREVGIDREHRHAGDERQHGATGGEEGGVRRADAPCQRSEQDGREQQRDENLEFMHGESKGESGSASSGSELRQPRPCGCIAHFRGPPVLRDRVVAAAQLLEGNRVVVNE